MRLAITITYLQSVDSIFYKIELRAFYIVATVIFTMESLHKEIIAEIMLYLTDFKDSVAYMSTCKLYFNIYTTILLNIDNDIKMNVTSTDTYIQYTAANDILMHPAGVYRLYNSSCRYCGRCIDVRDRFCDSCIDYKCVVAGCDEFIAHDAVCEIHYMCQMCGCGADGILYDVSAGIYECSGCIENQLVICGSDEMCVW